MPNDGNQYTMAVLHRMVHNRMIGLKCDLQDIQQMYHSLLPDTAMAHDGFVMVNDALEILLRDADRLSDRWMRVRAKLEPPQ